MPRTAIPSHVSFLPERDPVTHSTQSFIAQIHLDIRTELHKILVKSMIFQPNTFVR